MFFMAHTKALWDYDSRLGLSYLRVEAGISRL